MYNHAPANYNCPLCLGINKTESPDTLIVPSDIVYQDKIITILIGSFGMGNHPGHTLIVPNEHIENIFDIPVNILNAINAATKQIARALKEVRSAEGITILQNNEPAGGQHAFHYHQHVFPRFEHDELHQQMNSKKLIEPEARKQLADDLKTYLTNSPIQL
jgi:histidine triad (HIT) family protein